MKQTRLYFIDIVRAIAILMMLQGHFVDTLLDPQFRNDDYTAFRIWSYFRGITAPTFFTISGLIFTYLMLKAKQKGELNFRIKKRNNQRIYAYWYWIFTKNSIISNILR